MTLGFRVKRLSLLHFNNTLNASTYASTHLSVFHLVTIF
jgi:hypothetical protein